MMIDLIALGILTAFCAVGWIRGTISMTYSVVGLFAGYVGAFLLNKPVGGLLEANLSVPALLARPLGGFLAFAVVSVIVRFLARRHDRARKAKLKDGFVPLVADRAGGAALGGLWGLGVLVVVAWIGQNVHAVLDVGPDLEGTITGQVSTMAAREATVAAMRGITGDVLVSRMAGLMVGNPTEGLEAMSKLAGSESLRQVLSDESLRRSLAEGDVDAVSGHPALLSLASDQAFLEVAEQIGLIDDSRDTAGPAGPAGPEELAAELARTLAPVAGTVDALRSDPEIQRLIEESQINERLAAGEYTSLIADAQFNRLASAVLSKYREQIRAR